MKFESILVPENNGKQNLDKTHTNKHEQISKTCCWQLWL